uniref:Uncharacterized protein n=1 Tax=Ananas comosus var. bracteatus TaxID=296719 RepID=A0A6V7PA61_ANACO|nr:unnamed protein product [Ananas comosus var. bracteatus]
MCEFPASTVGVSARTRRRSVGFRRGLIRWIQDFERNPRSPYLPDFVEVRLVESVLYLTVANFGTETVICAFWSLIELDRDTLHTRLGSAHECHSGVRLVLLRWCRSCQLDLLSTDQLVWIEPDSRNGAGTGVFTVPGTEPQVSATAPSADQDRGKGVAR